MIELREQCPYIRTLGDHDECLDLCNLTEKPSGRIHPCLLVSGDTCEELEEIKKEWEAES